MNHHPVSTVQDVDHNVLVMSEAGKPIFWRHGSEEDVARHCSLVQAIRTATRGNGLGEIQSIESNNVSMVFLSVGSLTLVSIVKSAEASVGIMETQAFSRLQLEYVYAQLIFNITDQIQTVFRSNPGYDLRSFMASGDNIIRGLLDESGPDGNGGPLLLGAVQSLFPISHKLRKVVSHVLQSVGNKTENLAFAMIILGEKLLSLVQPPYRPHQLKASDLHLLVKFVNRQPGLTNSELWLPMCLPRFHSSGFLYAYTNCLEAESQLTLILVSSHNTTEQFQELRNAAGRIRDTLGFPPTFHTILTIHPASAASPSEATNPQEDVASEAAPKDVDWKREESFDIDDDYVTVSREMVGSTTDQGKPYAALMEEIYESLDRSTFESISKQYLEDEDASLVLHFLLRADFATKANTKSSGKGNLSQCICPSVWTAPFHSSRGRRKLWISYQQLNLRLRLGSATPEACQDAFDMISGDGPSDDPGFPGITRDCPAMGLAESPPNVHGITYILDGSEIFFAMNGRDFELYMAVSNTISVKHAAALGTKLVRRLMADETKLFLTSPLTWKE